MQRRACLALVFAVVGACGKNHELLDGGLGDGNGLNGGTGQVRVRGITPNRGPVAGGTSVVIDGQGFVDPNAGMPYVVFGDRVATNVAVVDDFTITATTPPGQMPGPVDVIVANNNGYGGLGGAYTYNPPPTVTDVQPPKGDMAGGTAVTLTGTGFQNFDPGTNTVVFGDLVATNVVVVSDTQITASTPPGPPFSTVDVAVTNKNGASAPDAKAYAYSAKGLIIGPDNSAGQRGLFFADTTSGLTIRVLKFDSGIVANNNLNALGTDGQGKIWGTTHYGSTPPELYSFDLFAQTVTDIGPVSDPTGNGSGGASPVDCRDIEFVGATLYCVQACCSNNLYSLDTTTGAATKLNPPPQQGVSLASIAGVTYAMYSQCCSSAYVATIDLSTSVIGTPKQITMGGNPLSIGAGKATEFNGALYFTNINAGGGGFAPGGKSINGGIPTRNIYKTDVTTGDTTLVFTVPFRTTALTKVE